MENTREIERERQHLSEVLSIARQQLDEAQRGSDESRDALQQAQAEMHAQSEQMFVNLWGSDDFEALASLNQLQQPLAVKRKTHQMELQRIQSLVRLLDAPYFARVDMRFDDGGDEEQVYIGRSTLKDAKRHEIYVHDWRSPIASVFYRHGLGSAAYDAPAGRITGQVLLKRQYEIRHGLLEFFFDADVQVQDEFLRKLLSKNASPRMKAIVETIQRDQDMAIRDLTHELLMVQGVAGSGKTSIALHRVAYLMYEGLTTHLKSSNILILSPNALFERYIESVLPELGERAVASATFERLLEDMLGAPVTPRIERFEAMQRASGAGRALLRRAVEFKGSFAFSEILDRYVGELPRRFIPFEDVCYGGETVATGEQLKQRALKRDDALPLGARLRRMEMSLWNGIRERRPRRIAQLTEWARFDPRHALDLSAFARACSMLESAILRRRIESFTRLDCRALYRRLIADEAAFRRLARGIELPDRLGDVLSATVDALDAGAPLAFEDAAAIAYLQVRIMGAENRGDIRQLVVDEAQDYGALHFSLLGRLYPRARFTVLGDINQAIDRTADMALYSEIERALNRRSAQLVELTKSFRCTSEILEFSLRFLPDARVESFNRSGAVPTVRGRQDCNAIATEIGRCRDSGCRSIALIAKTESNARAWSERLKLTLVDGTREPEGAFVIPLALSKGLEFDAVLVLDADAHNYGEREDRNLLFVACTRALHRLSVFYAGEPSPFLIETDDEVCP